MTALIIAFTMATTAGLAQQTVPSGYNHTDAVRLAFRIQAWLNKNRDLKAKFKQVYYKRYHGPEKPRWGYMWVRKPGRIRFDYASPNRKQLIVDGKKVWIYDPGYKQVIWQYVKKAAIPAVVHFLWGTGRITAEFWVKMAKGSKLAKTGTRVLWLRPRRATSTMHHLLFVVDPRTGAIREIIVYDHLQNSNRFVFMNVKTNSGIQKSRFSFTPPAGVQVIKGNPNKMNRGFLTPPPRRP